VTDSLFQVDDIIVYETFGVSRICEIIEKEGKQYYVIKPLNRTIVVRTPVGNNKVVMRRIMTEHEARNLINRLSEIEPLWIDDNKKRTQIYYDILRRGNCIDICRIIKALRTKNAERIKQKRNIPITDKNILDRAERLLLEEVSCVLKMTMEEVREQFGKYLHKH